MAFKTKAVQEEEKEEEEKGAKPANNPEFTKAYEAEVAACLSKLESIRKTYKVNNASEVTLLDDLADKARDVEMDEMLELEERNKH